MYNTPYIRPSLFGRALGAAKAFNFSSFLDGTQKTLGVINQAIPIVYQVKPMFQNARTMFRIADEIRKPVENTRGNTNTNTNTSVSASTNTSIATTNRPIFYI